MAKFFKHTDADNSKGEKAMITVERCLISDDSIYISCPADKLPDYYLICEAGDYKDDIGYISVTTADDGIIELDTLIVSDDFTRRGYGHKLMKAFCADLDKFGLESYLHAAPEEEIIDLDSLVKLYEDYGYEIINIFDQFGSLHAEMTRKANKGGYHG